MNRTVAEALGSTPHLSPVLHKARRLGFDTPDSLLRLAVSRGCTHYAPPNCDPAEVSDPRHDALSDLELAMALCCGAQQYEPLLIRCAAQLLGSDDIEAVSLARAARLERCEAIVKHIAQAAVQFDTGREEFWRTVLAHLPESRMPPPGVLPHPSRFMVQTGIGGPKRANGPRQLWLRPQRRSPSEDL